MLQARRDWPGNELADRLEVSNRTIRRDIERLRQLGYPVESLTGPAGGYQLRARSAMPPLLLDDDEAIAIAVGLRSAASASVTAIEESAVRALVKLEQVLPAHLRRRVGALAAATFTLSVASPSVDPQHLGVIAAACRDSECLRFACQNRDRVDSRGRAPLARQPRPPLVSRRLGSHGETPRAGARQGGERLGVRSGDRPHGAPSWIVNPAASVPVSGPIFPTVNEHPSNLPAKGEHVMDSTRTTRYDAYKAVRGLVRSSAT